MLTEQVLAGLTCFLFFSYSFLVAFRLMEDETSIAALYTITIVATLLLIAVQYFEARSLIEMSREAPGSFRGLVRIQGGVMAAVFLVFEALTWTAITRESLNSVEKLLFNARFAPRNDNVTC